MAATSQASTSMQDVCQRVVLRTHPKADKPHCVFTDDTSILLPGFLASFLRAGDTLRFSVAAPAENGSREVYIHRTSSRDREQDFLLAEIGYARQPREDARNIPTVTADVHGRCLGISTVQFQCDLLRDYFYVADRQRGWDRQPSFYELLRVGPNVSPTELRVAFKLRRLEIRASNGPTDHTRSLERAFNILAQPELRESYDKLLGDSKTAVSFPYGGFGSLLVSGGLSRDERTFFASRILSFRPYQSTKIIRAPLRNCVFYEHWAVYRDSRRKLEVPLDQGIMPLPWDPGWNRWKHLLGAQIDIKAAFVQAGRYRYRNGAWDLRKWETALPSRTDVTLPEGITDHITEAQRNYQRFGQFAKSLEEIRSRLESAPVERDELRRLCSSIGIPGDFDVSLITWKPDYEDFYYKQLLRRARHLYLFRSEYIFDLERLVVVETPQVGYATYLFAKPTSMGDFLALYRSFTREDILHNRNNAAERLGFLCRLIHGQNPQAWLMELKARLGDVAGSNAD